MNQHTKLIPFFDKNYAGYIILGLFIVTNTVYLYMLSVTIPQTMVYSGDMKLLDMMPTGYDLNYVQELFKTLGDTGREVYLRKQIPVDMVYPLLFGISYSLLLAYFLKKLNKLHSSLSYLCFLPLLAGLADYLENFGVIRMLKNYPELTLATVKTTNIFSLIKSISTTIYFIVLVFLILALMIRFIKRTLAGKL